MEQDMHSDSGDSADEQKASWRLNDELLISYSVTPPGPGAGSIKQIINGNYSQKQMAFRIEYQGNVFRWSDHPGFRSTPDGLIWTRSLEEHEINQILDSLKGLVVPILVPPPKFGYDTGGNTLSISHYGNLWKSTWSGKIPQEISGINPFLALVRRLSSPENESSNHWFS